MIAFLDFITFLVIVILVYYLFNFTRQLQKVDNLTAKSVVVTGSDTGFGHWLALKLWGNGIPVYGGCLTEDGQRGLTEAAEDDVEFLEIFPLDVSKQESADKALEFVSESLDEQEKRMFISSQINITICALY